MTIRERCIDIVEGIPDEQLGYIAAMLENAQKMIDEMRDDAYCLALYRSAKEDPENANGKPLEQMVAELGINLA